MKYFKILDSTQHAILKELLVTEVLLNDICFKLNNKQGNAQILALEDLGISNNVVRMQGGFYTGMYASWTSKIPFIPIDSTINACGVTLFHIPNTVEPIVFFERLKEVKKRYAGDKSWNLNVGNHFIALCEDTFDKKQYLVIHSSNIDYKHGDKGLYPNRDVWYYNEIHKIEIGYRYMRYIYGDVAEKFYELYLEAEKFNNERNVNFATEILENNWELELYMPHYGMPSISSIAIGCQWKEGDIILLSAPSKNIYLIESLDPCGNIFPHGFGVKMKSECEIKYCHDGLYINGNSLELGDFLKSESVENRYENDHIDKSFINRILDKRNLKIKKEFRQICSDSRHGIVYNP